VSDNLVCDDDEYDQLADTLQTIGSGINGILENYLSIMSSAADDAFVSGDTHDNLTSFIAGIQSEYDGGGIEQFFDRMTRRIGEFMSTIDEDDQFVY
jgi:hypothetical protein